MKREASQKPEGASLPEVMEKYGGVFSIALSHGYAHLKFNDDGEMYVTLLNDEGYVVEDGQEILFRDIERVANFMREMKQLRLPEYRAVHD